MNTTTEEKGELITLAETNTKSLFDGSGMDSMLAQIEQKARAYDLDISTPSGRKEVASVAYKIAQSKTAIDAAGKKLVEGIKAEAKVIDDERKKARDFLDNLKDEIRKPLTDFENAEKERVATLEARLARIESLCLDIPDDSAAIQNLLNRLNETSSGTFEEFEKRAAGLIAVAKERLTAKLEVVAKREAEAKELERLRAEAAERERIEREAKIARDAAEKAKIEAEALAAREKAAAEEAHRVAIEAEKAAAAAREKAIRDEAEAKELAAKEKAEAEKAAAAARAESERLAKEAEEKKEAARIANKKHREKVIGGVVAALIDNGIDGASASQAAILISEGKIPGASIQF